MSTETDRLESLQVLSFQLDGEYFAIEIERIQEVLEYRNVTRVPKAPRHMEGVINLRGQVIPVIDLRVYFGLGVTAPTLDTCIIIIDIIYHGEACAIGVVADSVKEVVEFSHDQIKPAPKIGLSLDNRFIAGMVEHDDLLMIVLSVGRIFADEELDKVINQSAAVNGEVEKSSSVKDSDSDTIEV